jgi:outer membrane protein, heavy metal efflux system
MKIFLTVQLFFCVSMAWSQSHNTIELDSLIHQALAYNPALQAAEFSLQSAQAKRTQSSAWNAPMVSVGFMDNPVSTLNFPKEGMMREYSLEQMIPFPGKISAAEDAALAEASMGRSSRDAYKRTLITTVKKQYAMLYSAQQRLIVNSENRDLLRQMISAAQSKYSVGQAMQADILRLQIELSKLENERSNLEQERRMTEGMLNTLRGIPPSTPLGTIAEILLLPPPDNVEALQTDAVAGRNELGAMKSDIMMKQADLAMSQRERWPDLVVGINYKEFTAMPDTWELMLGISIPFAPWTSSKYSGRIEENQLNIQSSESTLQEMINMVRFETYDAWSKTKASWEKLERYKNVVLPSSKQTLESLQSSYIANKVDFLSFIDSFRMLEMNTMEYYMEVAQYLSNRAELERAVGRDLE